MAIRHYNLRTDDKRIVLQIWPPTDMDLHKHIHFDQLPEMPA